MLRPIEHKQMNKTLLLLLIIGSISLSSCSTTYSDQFGKIDTEDILRVEFTSASDSSCSEFVKKHEHTDPEMIEGFIDALNNSTMEEKMWRGACWDNIEIIKNDTVMVFAYNTFVFGNKQTGVFFRFPNR